MDKNKYKEIVNKNTPKERRLKNSLVAFLVGGLMGLIGEVLVEVYSYYLNVSSSVASTFMSVTLVFIGCILTCFGVFDKLVYYARCGLLIPITGFAHSMQSTALEYKSEGLVTGIGMNIFKLAGTVILYGIVSAYTFGFVRYLIGG